MKELKKVKVLANVTVQFDKEDTPTGVEWINSYKITKRNNGKILCKEKQNNYNYLQDEERIYDAIEVPNEDFNFDNYNINELNKSGSFFGDHVIEKIDNKFYAIDPSRWN